MDYSRLRAAALRDGEDEEAVTVDTRALIDKVLARYSGEWTTLRELIQNAADAQATTVKVKWETLPSTQVPLPQTTSRSELLKHAIPNHTLRRLVVQNNGQAFTKTDWARLKRIAEGNPDETKIGAFGVGFYSVFADCEEPFISSGSEAMAFYWKGNALFTRKLQLSQDQISSDTAFVLDYRNSTTPVPNLLSVAQFLATSLTFVALEKIELWIDDYQVLTLHKKTSPSIDVPIPRDLETRTKDGLMKLASVERTSAQIDASFMSVVGWKPQSAAAKTNDSYYANTTTAELPSLKSFFSRLTSGSSQTSAKAKSAREEKAVQDAISEDLTATSTSSIFLRVTTGAIRTQVSSSFSAELERATKKPPPKLTKLAILTSSYDESQASENSSAANGISKSADVFASVMPSKKPGGRIFIGFPTTQTTGAGMHVSAPSVIPTVEREAIDLNARWVRSWNIEMLRVTGIITRLAFSNEMADLDAKLRKAAEPRGKGAVPSLEEVAKSVPEAMHILNTYTFKDSTPSGQVAQIIEEAFWMAYKRPTIEVYSSRGVLSTSKVRSSSDELSKFVSGIPVILQEMKDAPFIKKLTDFGLIKNITVDDVCQELSAKALDKDQLHQFIVWAGRCAASGELDASDKQRVLDVAVATISTGDGSGDIIALGSIQNYLSGNKIPSSMPIPPTTLPVAFTVNIPPHHLQSLGWEPLEVVPWLEFLIESASSKDDEQNLTKSPKFAGQVLGILSKNWENFNPSNKSSVVAALQHLAVMPTKMGMRKPGESFFPSVKLFDDLPVLQANQPPLKDKFLTALGVRKTVDLDTIFTRLLSPPADDGDNGRPKWSHVELIKYLASVKEDIPAEDMKKLKASRLVPAEAGPAGLESTKASVERYRVSELFEPKDTLRALKLPLLQWPGPPGSYRLSSPEARFLSLLGLRSFPTVPELVDMMAGDDAALRRNAMTYFIANHQLNHYAAFDLGSSKKAILPLHGDDKKLVPPSACVTNVGSSILGYNILRLDLHEHAGKFGVATHPSITGCVERLLANPPKDRQMAIALFEYFATRIGELGQNNIAKLRDAPIVPVWRQKDSRASSEKSASTMVYIRPQNCYLGTSSAYGDIFDFVDFSPNANTFLFKCGAKTEPTKVELAQLACGEPARLLSVLQSSEKYLNLLRTLAEDLGTLKKDRELFKKMRTSAFLLGSREISRSKGTESEAHDEDDAPLRQYQLAKPSDIVVLDDYISYRLFKSSLLCAPEEDALEAFYMALGSETLGSKIQEDVRIGPHTEKQEGAEWLRKHVLERSKIFLYEYAKYKHDSIKHDAKWLEKNLTVEVVRSVALRRSLKGHSQTNTERRSAASAYNGSSWVLYVAAEGKPDMYQVGQAICQLLLTRPSQQAYFFFEPFLKLDLLNLRDRGYNVDRILRAKAAEARIAEEERQKALEEEQRIIREREREWARQGQAAEAPTVAAAARQNPRGPDNRMPGAFDDTTDDDLLPSIPPEDKRPKKGLFSNLTRRLGFDTTSDEAEKQLNDFLPQPGLSNGTDKPGQGQTPGPGAGAGTGVGQNSDTKQPKDDGRVTSPAVVQQNLLNAIQSTRAHDSNKMFSAPQTQEIKEQATYCDSTPATNMNFAAEAPGGMRIFVAKDLGTEPHKFLSDNAHSIGQFERLLRDAGGVYGLDNKSMHIFYDEKGGTIAFNSNGSIFCNLRFFLQLHAASMKGADAGEGRTEATTWWWVVLAHELAHNLVKPHSSEHSYYT